jgi:amino acid transporter
MDVQNDAEKGPPHSEAGSVKMTYVEEDQGADSALHRKLNGRHLTMIGIGSSIGMGLWLGSGKGLANGGPATLFIGCKHSLLLPW